MWTLKRKHKDESLRAAGAAGNAGHRGNQQKTRKPVLQLFFMILFSAVIVLDLLNVKYSSNGQNGSMPAAGMPMTQMKAQSADSQSSGTQQAAAQSADSQSSGTQQAAAQSADSQSSGTQQAAAQSADSQSSGTQQAAAQSSDSQSGMPQMNGEMPQMADGNMPNAPGQGEQTLLEQVRIKASQYWIAILCAALGGDLLAVFFFISRVRKNKAIRIEQQRLREIAEENDDFDFEDDEEDDDETEGTERRRPVRAAVLPLCLVLSAATVIYQIPSATGTGSVVTAAAQVKSETAKTGKVSSILTGSGSLSSETAVAVSVPSGVTVDTYYVEDGSSVKKGEKLAKVDETSVREAVVKVQAALDDLDADYEAAGEEDETIDAGADGVIKAVYAESGDEVADVMEEHGALAVISLDGLMKVEIDADSSLSIGTKLTVTLSDGTEVTGRVESVDNGRAVITIDEENADNGEEVTVSLEDETAGTSKVLGTGTLEVHSPLKVTGYYGTISETDTYVDESVSTGDVLFTLGDSSAQAERTILLNTREKLQEQLQELYDLIDDPYVYAEYSGTADGIPDDAAETETEAAAETEATLVTDAAAESETETAAESETGAAAVSAAAVTDGSTDAAASGSAGVDEEDSTKTASGDTPVHISEGKYVGLVTSASGGTVTVKYAGYAETMDYAAMKAAASSGDSFQFGGSGLSSGDVIVFTASNATAEDGTEVSNVSYSVQTQPATEAPGGTGGSGTGSGGTTESGTGSGGTTESGTGSGGTTESGTGSGGTTESGTGSGGTTESGTGSGGTTESGTGSGGTTESGTAGGGTAESGAAGGGTAESGAAGGGTAAAGGQSEAGTDGQTAQQGQGGKMPSGSAMGSGSAAGTGSAMGGSASAGKSGAAVSGSGAGSANGAGTDTTASASATAETESSYDAYNLTGADILTVTPQDTMTITMEADEMDVLSLKKGQTAQITLDALSGRSFEGTVTAVNLTGENEGGNTKYSAQITISRTDDMLDGMNASVSIETDEEKGNVAIPAEALVEKDGKTYVYKSYDEETDTLSGLTEVETGVSDGASVEITSGLTEGEKYYYRYADEVKYTYDQ